jgi:hypothetical protein
MTLTSVLIAAPRWPDDRYELAPSIKKVAAERLHTVKTALIFE